MSVSNRLKHYCKEKRITQESLVHKGYGTKQTINNYLNGKTEPKSGFLEKFILEFRLSASWLMTGNEGKSINPLRNQLLKVEESEITTYSCENCIFKQKEIDALKEALQAKNELLEMYRKQNTGDKPKGGVAESGEERYAS